MIFILIFLNITLTKCCKENEVLYYYHCVPKNCYNSQFKEFMGQRQSFTHRIIHMANQDIAVDLMFSEQIGHPYLHKDDPESCIQFDLKKSNSFVDLYGTSYDTEIISSYEPSRLQRTWRFIIKTEDIFTTLIKNTTAQNVYFGNFRYIFYIQSDYSLYNYTIDFITQVNNMDASCISEICKQQVNTSLSFCKDQEYCDEMESIQIYRNQNVTIKQKIEEEKFAKFFLTPRHVQIIGNQFFKIIDTIYYQQLIGFVLITFNLDFNYDRPFQIQITSQLGYEELKINPSGAIATAVTETLDCIKVDQQQEGCRTDLKQNGNLLILDKNDNLILILLLSLYTLII